MNKVLVAGVLAMEVIGITCLTVSNIFEGIENRKLREALKTDRDIIQMTTWDLKTSIDKINQLNDEDKEVIED